MSPIRHLHRSFQTSALAWRIARHYLFSRERQALEWLATIISVAGVAVGVGTIITVFGVIDGMETRIISRITSNVPSLVVYNTAWNEQEPAPEVMKTLRAEPGVQLAEPMLSIGAMVVLGKNRTYMRVYATEGVQRLNFFNIQLPEGVEALRPEPRKILVSESISTQTLKGRAGTLITERAIRTALYPIPKSINVTVKDTFKIANRYFGSFVAFATWQDVRELLRRETGVQSIYVKLADPMRAVEIKEKLLAKLPAGTKIESWTDDFEQMFTDMQTVKFGMFLVMLMTMVVAALNIIGTLTLIVIQKTREVGILKAMGAPRALVGRIFLAEGAMIGAVGSVLGTGLGLGVSGLVTLLKIPMPGHLMNVREIPVELSGWVVVLTGVVALAVSTLAALAPAWRAASLNPVEALRHE